MDRLEKILITIMGIALIIFVGIFVKDVETMPTKYIIRNVAFVCFMSFGIGCLVGNGIAEKKAKQKNI